MSKFSEALTKYRSFLKEEDQLWKEIPAFSFNEVRALLMGIGSIFPAVTWVIWKDEDMDRFEVEVNLDRQNELYYLLNYEQVDRRGKFEFISRSAAKVTALVYDLYFIEHIQSLELLYGPLHDDEGKPSWIMKAWKMLQDDPTLFTRRYTDWVEYVPLEPNE